MESAYAALAGAALLLIFMSTGCVVSVLCERRIMRSSGTAIVLELVRLMTRGESRTAHAAPFLAWLAPVLILAALPLASTHPLGESVQTPVADWSLLGIVALAPLAALTPLWCGWCSVQHIGLLSGLRATILHVSYAACLALALAAIALNTEALELAVVVERQTDAWGPLPRWNIFLQPMGAVAFLGWLFVWVERKPFGDGAGSGVLVSGYRSCFVGGDLALLRIADHARLFVGASLAVVLYGGGWHDPAERYLGVLGWGAWGEMGVFLIKALVLVAALAWLRRALPAFDYAQSLRLLFFFFLPLAIANLLWVALVASLGGA
jgi:NADH:ubiquinone oxidoreductase subunit H